MAVDFTLTQGDIGWTLQGTAKDADGNAINITGYTLKFIMWNQSNSTADNINAAATAVDSTAGSLKYVGTTADAGLAVGYYTGHFQLDPTGDSVFYVPTNPKLLIQVVNKEPSGV